MSYNNRPAADVIPLLTPLVLPSARVLGPLVNQVGREGADREEEGRGPRSWGAGGGPAA
jgi:hypothetical protein